MSVNRDSYISKLCNLTHTHTHTHTHIRLEAVNSSRISTNRSYPEHKPVILKVTSPIPAGLLRSPSFFASSFLLSFRCGKSTGNGSREEQILKENQFLCVRKIKKLNIASSYPRIVMNNYEKVEVGLRKYSFVV
jgi:hypothetical protein